MSHSTHILLTSGSLITKGSLRKDESLWQKCVEELVCLLLVFLLNDFCLRVQTNNLIYVTAGFVVSLQGFDVG